MARVRAHPRSMVLNRLPSIRYFGLPRTQPLSSHSNSPFRPFLLLFVSTILTKLLSVNQVSGVSFPAAAFPGAASAWCNSDLGIMTWGRPKAILLRAGLGE